MAQRDLLTQIRDEATVHTIARRSLLPPGVVAKVLGSLTALLVEHPSTTGEPPAGDAASDAAYQWPWAHDAAWPGPAATPGTPVLR